jgi:hypothetical protein
MKLGMRNIYDFETTRNIPETFERILQSVNSR